MSSASVGLAEKPAHVPTERVVDFDFGAPAGAGDGPIAAFNRLHDGPDLFWTPRNGGHWIATRASDIEFVQKHSDPFSMRRVTLPEEGRPPVLPLELDPPVHSRYRTIINSFFTPRAVKGLQDEARILAIDLIEGFKHSGQCEFIGEFAQRLPITIFMKMVDQPADDTAELLGWAEAAVRPKAPGDRVAAHQKMQAYLRNVIQERRSNPRDDLLSAVIAAEVNGEPIAENELMGMLTTIMFGGLDTVASSLGVAAQYLAEHPDQRRQLIARPELIANAADELIRLASPSSTARTLTSDIELSGVLLKAGDKLWVKPLLHALDKRKFDNPLEADWERPALERNYAAFGNGPHRCPGATLARSEIRIFLEEWLTRIPDFRVDPDQSCTYGFGMVTALLKLPLIWDPASVR
ncbi:MULTISPECIES: cytochrome P450 [unclassified Sphingobium]|uniref:cytochrome P450 n=1 Tax=unclassified Sphingobium TaxID=2611147 RepID=UPI000D163E52|nr:MULTISPECIES: cytochrome P450 [unclassified Sphingobium]MBG6120010.1 cytochrome P450 [Sphingobium sp. JAI105]PSO12929.1 cytochrome P450 [Sphingobium sp. AEW4]TWD05789.1 cytochrome P450 [Sphingobium sp. AEW010]TWD23342.1 cytochrome P450 [Sphingobium sp. AEW013]TWD25202.1 cytochrome P450 [Sphingobium sp. AEW001]